MDPFLTIVVLLSCPWIIVLSSADSKQTRWPLYSMKPLLLVWNAPTEECKPRHGIEMSLGQFHIVASPNEAFYRQNLTIFYKERLGLYPYYERDGTAVNGGLPQLASLTQHYKKMPEGVHKYIHETDAKGLAVIDWEEWRPLWIRNWGSKDVYRNKSREMVARKNQDWSSEQVAKVAQQEFELSARKFMLETLKYAKNLRPNQLWGFYLFPDCYNHDYRSGLDNYSGRCPTLEMSRNDQLNWLWKECTALYPSIYIGSALSSTRHGRLFVRNRVMEAMRVASVGNGTTRPVFVYTRPTYTGQVTPLSEMDLISTIGESVALGAAGVILWGDASYTSNLTCCSSLYEYLKGPLGRYLLNVSTAAELCSETLCKFHGRCLRKVPDQDVYLHLSASSHTIVSQGGQLKVRRTAAKTDLTYFRKHFQCQCYTGYWGEGCTRSQRGRNKASSVMEAWHICLLFPAGLLTLLH